MLVHRQPRALTAHVNTYKSTKKTWKGTDSTDGSNSLFYAYTVIRRFGTKLNKSKKLLDCMVQRCRFWKQRRFKKQIGDKGD
jgi:hypothetical protein